MVVTRPTRQTRLIVFSRVCAGWLSADLLPLRHITNDCRSEKLMAFQLLYDLTVNLAVFLRDHCCEPLVDCCCCWPHAA